MKNIINLFLILLFGCDVPDKYDVTVDAAQNGTLKGKIVAPYVKNSNVVWEGIQGANVQLEGTSYSTTSLSGGLFAFEGIPSGGYNIKAKMNDPYYIGILGTGTISTVVIRQSVVDAGILQLPVGYARSIIYGKIYYSDKQAAFANKPIKLFVSASKVLEETTSNIGEYAFDAPCCFSAYLRTTDNHGNWLNPIVWINPDRSELYLSGSTMKEINAYVSE